MMEDVKTFAKASCGRFLTVMNGLKYFFSQDITNPQPYNAYVYQDAYALIVILLPRHLLELLLYVLELFPRLFT